MTKERSLTLKKYRHDDLVITPATKQQLTQELNDDFTAKPKNGDYYLIK